ncbi:MAG: anaerobic carbon-monoxide dehydrogenase catalytic subunit [Acetobacteraceae bacterium]|nr:anaerobic carbon-monoxide dehydrogenase catalytic subunit [Acetobacteraceae bacterium]
MSQAERDPISQHESVRSQYPLLQESGASSVVDRFQAQGVRCGFCSQGLSCRLCSNGPCRVSPRTPRGACGIDGSAMAMRNLLHLVIMGAAAYTHHAQEAARTLEATSHGRTPFALQDPRKLETLSEALGIGTGGEAEAQVAADPTLELAGRAARALLHALHQPSWEESVLVRALSPARRQEAWRRAGLFPGGPAAEIIDSAARGMTNIDGDYVSLARAALRLAISVCYGALAPLEMVQDALFGTPRPHPGEVDLGVIDPEYVNILPHGHEPFLGAALILRARRPEVQAAARRAGAKGLRVVGSIETGQELLQRFECDGVFAGLCGNWPFQEFALATGAVDVLAMDMNCSLPSLKEVADRFGTRLVAVSRLIGVPGVADRFDYEPHLVERQARAIVDLAIENFRQRRGRPARPVPRRSRVVAGFSTEALLSALGGSLDPLLQALKSGRLKGVVALVSCSSLKGGGQDTMTVAVARELIARDLLVVAAGCGNAACQVAGLSAPEAAALAGPGLREVCRALGVPPVLSFGTCTDTGRIALLAGAVADALRVDVPALPLAVTAPEYMEQKATLDAFAAVALGLYTHVAPLPPVAGAPELVRLLTQDVEGLVGGRLAVETEPGPAVAGIEAHILGRRKALGM